MSYTADWTYFRATPPFTVFSDETTYSDTYLDTMFDNAQLMMPETMTAINSITFSSANQAMNNLYLMTAHLITLNNQIVGNSSSSGYDAGGAGIATSVSSSGGLSINYVAPPSDSELTWWLNQTPFGQQLAVIITTRLKGGFLIGGSTRRRGFN